jgi:hypothetical protein
MQFLLKIEILISIFILFVVVFTFLYKMTDDTLSYSDALYLAASYQTFTGASSIEDNKKIRNIATVQMIVSYILVAIVLYSLVQC